MKTAIKSLILLALIASFSTAARASVVYIQPHNGSGSLYQSALNGTDYDQLTWDMFRVTNSIAITEIRWRGGYLYGGAYSGRATNWTIAVYRDIANGFEPDIISPPFAIYSVSGNAGETVAGTFAGTTLYDYAFTLPSPFQATAGSNYWLLIQANQSGIPEWGMALGSGPYGGCFRRVAGMADWYFYRASGDLAFSLLASDGPTATIAAAGSPDTAGEILGAGAYPIGSIASLVARPATGYGFVNWTENGAAVSTSPTYQFPVSTNRSLVANFTTRYNIAVNASPAYGGSTTGGGAFNSNATVTVLATAAPGYSFVDWTEFGTPVSASVDYTFNVEANRTLVANFAPSAATATFDFDSGMPPVFPTQGMPGSQWNNGLTAYFSTLSGAWSIQNTFYGWVPGVFSGNFLYPSTWSSTLAVSFSQPVTNITLAFATGDVSSEYDIPTTVRLTAYADASMTVPVAMTTAKGAWITGAYPEGTVSLGSAAPFTKVKIDMPSGQNPPVSYILFVDNIVVQQVIQPPVIITASAAPAGGGTITGDGTVANGASVDLVATPNTGYEFVDWTENGTPVYATLSYSFTATTNRSLVANFVQLPPTFVVMTSASPSNGGTTTGDGIYNNGQNVALTATRNTGYDFVNWTENGLPVCAEPGYTFPIAADRFLVANFAAIPIPKLEIQTAANSLVLSWPTNSAGFSLEQNGSLQSATWAPAVEAVNVVGTNYQVIISPLPGSAFFRLVHP